MRNLILLITLIFISNSLLASNKSTIKQDDRPNIIFLLTDDQRYNALGCMGNDEIKTPNIDMLAERGILFRNHYNTTAICMASRATIMTGMYEFKSGCNFTHGPVSTERFQKSYPVLLREAGYRTGFAGKFGFAVIDDEFGPSNYHSNNEMPMHEFDWWRGWPGQGYYQTEKNEFMKEYAEEYPHVSKALGAAASDFIKESAKIDKPFCLSVSFKAPHSPVSPDKAYDDVYENATFTKPVNYGPEGAEHLPEQAKQDRQYQRLFKNYEPDKYDKSIAKYYQQIYGVDVAVGMIMKELEKYGLEDNTVIMYTTDNGYFLGAHAFGGKVLPYEEGSRGPLIICGPEKYLKNKGRSSKALTGNIDMAPTILELAGVSVPENMDGESLVPLMQDKKKKVKDHQMVIQTWGNDPIQALTVVNEDYKYIYWFYGEGMEPQEELYSMKNDHFEMINLVNDKKHKKGLNEIRATYKDYLKKWNEECVKGNNYPKYGTLFDQHTSWENKKGLLKNQKRK